MSDSVRNTSYRSDCIMKKWCNSKKIERERERVKRIEPILLILLLLFLLSAAIVKVIFSFFFLLYSWIQGRHTLGYFFVVAFSFSYGWTNFLLLFTFSFSLSLFLLLFYSLILSRSPFVLPVHSHFSHYSKRHRRAE